jgi:hypothetical protein
MYDTWRICWKAIRTPLQADFKDYREVRMAFYEAEKVRKSGALIHKLTGLTQMLLNKHVR